MKLKKIICWPPLLGGIGAAVTITILAYITFNSNINLEGQLFNQLYNTEKKNIESNKTYSGNIFRSLNRPFVALTPSAD